MAIVPFVIVLVAVIMIVSLGATSGSYSDAVGIGIDFEGGTILTVTLGESILDDSTYQSEGNAIKTLSKALKSTVNTLW